MESDEVVLVEDIQFVIDKQLTRFVSDFIVDVELTYWGENLTAYPSLSYGGRC